jgi:hypothetical protein
MMSMTAILAFFVLGCDFLVVVLFHWLFGEKRPKRSTRAATSAQAMSSQSRYDSAPASAKAAFPTNGKSPITRSAQAASAPRSDSPLHRAERLAHQRIAASFARSRA